MPRRSQQDRSRATRAALTATAHRLFAEHGWHQVSAEQIVAAAGVTRGALYHHYGDKQGLFRAVFEELEAGVAAEIAAVLDAAPDRRAAVVAALGRFLDVCRRPDVLRIALTDAPAVLGWQTWREIEARHGLGLITRWLEAAGPGVGTPVLAQLVLSAVIEAALVVAHAPDPAAARADVERSLLLLLSGLVSGPVSGPVPGLAARPVSEPESEPVSGAPAGDVPPSTDG